ncbi:hypothetical protein ABIA69_004259 [Lysinibacillus parviboronicapiens]|uniref:ABC transporter permease n=1 Tax=Lysinibacillus parviboronicapiens TaxID=436516 RepID=A0ABV2PQ51_9BACI|nr:hypothetical protein [Lysinibacillus parviboronicapiens]
MKKYRMSFILFFLVALLAYPTMTTAETKKIDAVEVDICIIGGDNHFVYKIPKHLHNDTTYFEMKDYIETSLSSHWKVEDAHYETNQSNVAYTFFIEDLFQERQNGQLKISIPYSILVGMFGEDEGIQLRIMASKLTNWKVNAKEWTSLGFVQPFTFLSEREYVFEGAVNELLQQRVGHLDGSFAKGQMILYSVIYFSFILVQVASCLFLARRLKNRILQFPEEIQHFRKLNYMYQIIPLMIITAQIVFLVMSGLLTAFGLYFNPGIDLLFIVGPVLLNIIVLPMFFVTTEREISKELRNNSVGTGM